MARTRTIRRAPIKTSRKRKNSRSKSNTPWLLKIVPAGLQAFFARRVVDVTAGIFTLGGLFLLAALWSYTPHDPSLNVAAADDGVQNWMGLYGAWSADAIIQTFGVGAFMAALVSICWGVRIFNRASLTWFIARVVALGASVALIAAAFAPLPSGNYMIQEGLGGSIGSLILTSVTDAVAYLIPSVSPLIMAALCGVLAIITSIYASTLKLAHIGYALQKTLIISINAVLATVETIQRFISWIGHHNDEDARPDIRGALDKMPRFSIPMPSFGNAEEEAPAPQKKAPTMRAEPVEAAPESKAVPRQQPNIPVVATPAKATKVETPQQRFSLDGNAEWAFPSLDLLEAAPEDHHEDQLDENALRRNAELLQNVLADFNVEGEITSIHPGPVVTLYELEPAPGTKSAKVIGLADDIARSMSAISVRVAVVPGRNVIGIELPNKSRQIVYMQDLLATSMYEKSKASLPLVLGKDIGGQPILADLAKMPHLLVAGTTGSGKSVAVNTMILSLLYRLSPEQCRFIMIDPKMLELSVYDGIPHLLSPVVTEPGKAVVALKWTVQEMEERYRAMSKLGVRNIHGYNERVKEAREKGETIVQKVETGFDPETGQKTYEDQEMDLSELPFIVVIVDEFADLMLVAGKDVENAIQRLAQMARAAGIHLIMATQRPSVDVITGVIKANFPTRISFQVTSKVDSRTILGEGGAEQLLGMGDMLYMAPGGRITRVHGPFVSDDDVEKVVADLKAQAEPAYIDSITSDDFSDASEVMQAIFTDRGSGGEKVDELYDEAVALVAREGKASTSFIQRYLQIGYNRAARIIEEMEKQGVVSKATATGKREVLISDFSDV
ncbi:MAG: DNA translocase FtsK 4TM domain-containing protein [Alphaproteobacteria bacterium]|nr:DNA translocase FtsK 4TM domain-containing protein [Alphaproteobacteria bacterium]